MSVTFREADGNDRLALEDLWVEAWTVAMPEIDFRARRGWFEERLTSLRAAGGTVIVACDVSGSISGLVTVDPRTGDLDQLAVATAARRQGLGRQLIDEAKRRSPAGLSLTVNTGNHPAVALYRSAGFVVVGDGRNERSGLPVWHMQWTP